MPLVVPTFQYREQQTEKPVSVAPHAWQASVTDAACLIPIKQNTAETHQVGQPPASGEVQIFPYRL